MRYPLVDIGKKTVYLYRLNRMFSSKDYVHQQVPEQGRREEQTKHLVGRKVLAKSANQIYLEITRTYHPAK